MWLFAGKVLAGKYGYAYYVCTFWRENVYGGGKYDVTVTTHYCRRDACFVECGLFTPPYSELRCQVAAGRRLR